ncbi:cytochrome c oxidase assembly factor 6 homolog isoform 1-T1 [Sarcoramphus papa]
MSAPTMEERKACWGARDEFWQCLDRHADDASKCEKLRLCFESRCPQQWVSSRRSVRVRLHSASPKLVLKQQSVSWHGSNSTDKLNILTKEETF